MTTRNVKKVNNTLDPPCSMCFSPNYKQINLITANLETRSSDFLLVQLSTTENIVLNKLEIREIKRNTMILDCVEDFNRKLFILTSDNNLYVYDLNLPLDSEDTYYHESTKRNQNLDETTFIQLDRAINIEFPLKPLYTPKNFTSRGTHFVRRLKLNDVFKGKRMKNDEGKFSMDNKRLFFDRLRNRIVWWRNLKEVVEVNSRKLKNGVKTKIRYTIQDKVQYFFKKKFLFFLKNYTNIFFKKNYNFYF